MANSRDLMGKLFLVKDELEKYDWKMTGETKNIGQYTCYQAIHEREVENINISMVNGESKEVVVSRCLILFEVFQHWACPLKSNK